MRNEYDVAVIGGGPAGCTAALYTAGAGLKTVLVERLAFGGQMTESGKIVNYPGFDAISGLELGEKMRDQAKKAGAEILSACVNHAALRNDPKILRTGKGDIAAKAVIIATGAAPRKLGIPGEEELTGLGVSYCAACDGRNFRGKTVCVVGGGYSAAEDAAVLSRICGKVYLIHRRDSLRISNGGFETLKSMPGTELLLNTEVKSAFGKDRLEGVTIYNNVTHETSELLCDGLFIAAGRKPNTEMFADELVLDESGFIKADETTLTSLRGVLAAGDVRSKALRQIVSAAADGAAASKAAEKYIETI